MLKKEGINRQLIIFIILITGILAPIAIDEYAPSMPAMVKALHSSVAAIQYTITIFLAGMGIGQVIMGPLSDRYGRKKVLQSGIVVFLAGTLLCIFAVDTAMILVGRAIQGLGIASAAMTTTALIGDLFEGDDIHKVTGYFVLVYGLVPIIAPVLGGHLQDWIGWRANFVFMFIFVLFAFFLYWFFLPETHVPTDEDRIHFSRLRKAYATIFTNARYMFAVMGGIFSWSMIITFSIVGPFLIQDVLHYSATIYGYSALGIGLGFFIGNILNTKLLAKVAQDKLLNMGIWIALGASIALLVMASTHFFNIWTIVIPSFFAMFGIGFAVPNYYGKAVSVFTKRYVGIANSLIGSLILFGTVFYSFILNSLHAYSPITLGAVYTGLGIANMGAFVLCKLKSGKAHPN